LNDGVDLLALNNSVEQHVHFSEGSSPERLLSYSKTHLGQNASQRDKENFGGKINGQNDAPKKDLKFRTPNILRTVYLENSDIVDLRKELEGLQKEVVEDRYIYDQQIHQARNEKAQLDEYSRQELLSDNDKIVELIKEFEAIDQLSLDTFCDYGQLLQDSDSRIRQKQEQNEQLRLENTRLAIDIKKVKDKCESELNFAEQEYTKCLIGTADPTAEGEEGEQVISPIERFKQQSDIQTEYIEIIKDQYEKIQDIYRQKSKLLLNKIEKSKAKMSKTEARRSLELGGYYEDLRLLNKK